MDEEVVYVPKSDLTFIPVWADGYYVSLDGNGSSHYIGRNGNYETYNGKLLEYELDVNKWVVAKGTDLVIGEYYAWGIFDEKAIFKENCAFAGWQVEGQDKIYKFGEPIKVNSDMKIKAVWKEKGVFEDVNPNKYYFDAVYWALDKGVTKGTTATTFSPENPCTRGQFVTFLWRAMGSPELTIKNKFTDVEKGKYYYKAGLWAAEKGITTGTSDTTFSPDDTCKREQCATFIYRAANKPKVSNTDYNNSKFTDVQKGKSYSDAVIWAYKNGITTGVSATKFGVGNTCTRGQLVTFLYRYKGE